MLTTMTTEQALLVQRSFARVRPIADAVAGRFYARLFTLDPTLRRLFSDDLSDQRHAVMAMLQVVVAGFTARSASHTRLSDSSAPSPPATAWLERDYDTVGEALLSTLPG